MGPLYYVAKHSMKDSLAPSLGGRKYCVWRGGHSSYSTKKL